MKNQLFIKALALNDVDPIIRSAALGRP